MAIRVQLFDGSLIEFPDNTAQDVIDRVAKQETLARQPAPQERPVIEPPKKEGLGAAFGKGLESLISSGRTAVGAFTGSPEQAALAAIERQKQSPYADQVSMDKVSEAYKRGLLPAVGEVARQVPLAISEQAPNILATLGSARLGAMAGAGIGSIVPGLGTAIGGIGGGILGAVAPSLLQQFGGNIQRQAQEQQAQGRPIEINRAAAGLSAVPQAGLDVAASLIPLGRTFAGKVLGPQFEELLKRGSVEGAERLAKESLGTVLGKGAAISIATEVPTEVIQTMLERSQAGLALTTPDAFAEYGNVAYQASLLAPIGAVGRVGERSVARTQSLLPGQRRGESDMDFANRLSQEIDLDRRNVAAQQSAQKMQDSISNGLLTPEVIKQWGFGKGSIFDSLVNKNLSNPEDASFVADVLASYRPKAHPNTQVKIDDALAGIKAMFGAKPTSQTEGAVDAGAAITEPSGAGVQVAVEPDTGAATPRLGAPEPAGVVPPVEDVGQPAGGAEAAPVAVAPIAEPVAPVPPKEGALQGSQTRLILPDGEKRPANWEVIEADSVSASLVEGQAQPRDRQRAASNAQVKSIANNPDFDRLSDTSQTMDYGAPTLTSDYVIVGGNGRFEGINLAYNTEAGQSYKQNLINNSERLGLDPAQVSGMKKPVLIRKLPADSAQPEETRKLAIQSNIVAGLEMSDMERAALDSERMTNLNELDITDTGDIPLTTKNMGTVRDALKGYTKEELSGMLAADGSLSQSGLRRVKNAVLYKAYGKTDTLSRLLESPDPDLKNVGTALMRASGNMSRLMDGIKSNAIPSDYDIIADLTGAVETLSALRASGTKVQDFINQSDMFGGGLSNESKTILTFLDQNLRSAKSITEFLNDYANAAVSAESAGDGLFGEVQLPSKQETIERAAQRPEAERAAAKSQQTIFEQPAGETVAEGAEKPEGQGRPVEGGKGEVTKPSLAEAAPQALPITPEIQAKIDQLERVLKKIMGKFGLKDVALKLIDNMKAEGEYAQSVVRLALDAVNPVQALRHESVHALKELGFFTPQQWKVLEKQAQNKWIDQYLKTKNINKEELQEGQKSRYDAYMELYKGDMDAITEEAIADAFGDFDATKAPAGLMQAILQRLRNFFDAIKTAFGGEITAEQVFRKVEKGALKAESPATKAVTKASLRGDGFESFDEDYKTPESVADGFKRGDLLVHARTKDDTDFRYGIEPSTGELVKSTDSYQSMIDQYGEAPDLTFFSDNTSDTDSWAKFFAKRDKPVQMVFVRKSDSMQKSLGNGKVMTSDGKTMSYEMSPLADYEDQLMRGEPAFVETGDWYTNKDQDVVAVMDYVPAKPSLRDAAKIDVDRSLNDKRISPRMPTAVKAKEETMGKVRLQPDLDTFKRDNVAFRHNIGLMSQYPNFAHIKGRPDQRAEQMIDHMKENLLWLFNSWDQKLRDRSKLWYVGGNRISHRWAEKYGIPAEQAAGIIAALSPQKDWFQNVSLAERTLDALVFNADTMWSPEMTKVFKERAWAKKFPLRKYQGTTLKDMYKPGDAKSLVDMSVWIRAWDEANNPQMARVITPEGTFTKEMAAGKTGKPVAMRAQSFAAMVKTLQVLQQSDIKIISDLIGKNHKVRSFYNNIIAPYAGDDVTIDTHAVAAALLRPLGSSDLEVYHNFGSAKPAKKDKEGNILIPASAGTKNSAVTGLYGTYAMYAEAYRRAAEDAGVLPREMQSITWEAIRGLFRPEQKQARLKQQTNVLWNKAGKGEINGQSAREQISKLVSGIEDPAWAKSPVGANESPTDSSYADKLPRTGVPGREPGRVPSGVGERVAGAVPKLSLRDKLGMYSELENKIEAGSNKAPSESWKSYINGLTQKGVKPEEIEWSGVRDWLDLRKGTITKEELLNYLKQGGVKVEETVLGGPMPELQGRQRLAYEYEQAIDRAMDADVSVNPTYIERLPAEQRAPEEQALLDAWNRVNENPEENSLYDRPLETKYGQYTLPGGENYREVLLTLPREPDFRVDFFIDDMVKKYGREAIYDVDGLVSTIKSDFPKMLSSAEQAAYQRAVETTQPMPMDYFSSHWNQPNVLAHIRVNDRTDANGNKVLFVEEIQSDWGQEGKKKGFRGPLINKWETVRDGNKWYSVGVDGNRTGPFDSQAVADYSTGTLNSAYGGREMLDSSIPTAPFVATQKFAVFKDNKEVTRTDKDGKEVKQRYDSMEAAEAAAKKVGGEARSLGLQANTEGWLNLALKRIMVMAAEGGYDKVAFVNGEQSADRYDLSKQVDRIDAKRRTNDTYDIDVSTKQGQDFNRDGLTPEQLEAAVGKEMAQKIIDATASDQKRVRFSGLDLKVGGEGMKTFYDTIVPTALKKLLPKVGGGQMMEVDLLKDSMKKYDRFLMQDDLKILGEEGFRAKYAHNEQPGFDVTPAMREKVQTTGLPRFSLRVNVPASAQARIVQTTVERKEQGFVERLMEAISPSSYSDFRAQALNRYNQLGVYDQRLAKKMGGIKLLADTSAEAAALLSDLAAGITASALGVHDRMGGVPVFRNGITIVSNQNGTIKGPTAIFAPLAGHPNNYRAYQYWAGVKRGSRFMADGTEKLFTPADIIEAENVRKSFLKEGIDFNVIQKEWIKYNDGLVQYMIDTGVLSKDRADQYRKHADYLPFYRQIDGKDTVGPRVFQAISGVKPPKKIKGSESPLDDFLENIVRNTQSAIQAGVKNVAAQRAANVAESIGMANRLNHKSTIPGTFDILENGQVITYYSKDHLFINAIKSLGLPDLPFIGLLSGPANLLRNLVTKDPGFMLANLMRDSMSAWVTSGVKMAPIANTITNFGSALAGKDPNFQALMNAGILGGYEFSQNVEQSGREFGKALRKQAKIKSTGVKGVVEMGTKPFTSLWDALEKGTTASDAATRMEVYKRTLAETNNEAEALFRALEVMNFNRKGSSAVVRILTAAVPFLNARMQGLDILYRASTGRMNAPDAAEIQKRFFVRGATIAALSAAYWLLTNDDEEYKKQEQETRDNYWLLPSLGIKIPIPFEVGVLFKVIPERILGYAFGSDTGEDFLKSMSRQLTSTLAFNPIPQAVMPVIETMTNFSFFTMRPIVGQGLEGLQPAYQVGPGTSRLAEGIGEMTKGMAKELQISPMKVDQLINGYTGTMGMYLVNLMDAVYDMNADSPKPSRRFEQMPLIRRFALDPEARGNVTAYYELKNSVDAVVRTSNMLERTMNYEEAPGYMIDNMQMLASKDYILDLEKTMKEFREMKIMIRSANMGANEKRDAVLAIDQMENQLTSNIQYMKKLAKGG